MVFFLFSDLVFFSRSLGKRICHIKITNSIDELKKVPIMAFIYRRLLEVSIHPLFTKSFYATTDIINKKTNTRVCECCNDK